MMPISEIQEGDIFQNPLIRGVMWYVEKVNVQEKMVLVQAYGGSTMQPVNSPSWIENTHRMFDPAWKVN